MFQVFGSPLLDEGAVLERYERLEVRPAEFRSAPVVTGAGE